jgi:spore coat protein U-like protein
MPGESAMKRILGLAAAMLLAPATGQAVCSVSASGVAFGVYNPFAGGPQNATGTVTVNCSQFFGTYTVALNGGLNGGSNFSNRRLSAGTASLGYQLYMDAGHTAVWGDGTGGSVPVNSATCFGNCNTTYSVFGRIPARQAVSPATYGDTILVTVTFF